MRAGEGSPTELRRHKIYKQFAEQFHSKQKPPYQKGLRLFCGFVDRFLWISDDFLRMN